MTYTGVHLDGAKAFRRDLKRAQVPLNDLRKPYAAAGKIVATAARPRTPRRTGALARTVRNTATRTKGGVRAGNAGKVPYANPIHWGWSERGIRAQPWLSQTAQQTEPRWIKEFEQLMEHVGDMLDRGRLPPAGRFGSGTPANIGTGSKSVSSLLSRNPYRGTVIAVPAICSIVFV